MRIVYAVHGYGRGHATRALAVLPHLARRHKVLVLAGGDAYSAMWPDYPVVRIPTLGFAYGMRSGARSNWATLKRNLPAMLDLILHGPVFNMVRDAIRDFAPDVVIADAEAWTHRCAKTMGIPRISFDHIGIMEYCRPRIEWHDRLEACLDTFCYRQLMLRPERVIVSSFYNAPAKRPGVCTVGTLPRQAVRDITRTRGDHLLVYFNQGHHQFGPRILQTLEQAGCPVHIYGTERRGKHGQLKFLPTSNLPFIEDLASCRAVISTAGNQLMGEAISLGKPVLVMPERCVEQRLNAAAVERLGIGMRTTLKGFTPELLAKFLGRLGTFASAMSVNKRDGLEESLAAIERFLAELAPSGSLSPVLRGEGGGEGLNVQGRPIGRRRGCQGDSTAHLLAPPLTPTLSPGYRGEGAGADGEAFLSVLSPQSSVLHSLRCRMRAGNLALSILSNRLGAVPRPSWCTYLVCYHCNARCGMCDSWRMKRGYEMTPPEVRDVFRKIGRLDVVRLSGGEPFLHPDMSELAAAVMESSRPSCLHITTNGSFPDRAVKFVEDFASPEKLRFMVSFDGAEAEHDASRGKDVTFATAMETVRRLADLRERYGIAVSINHTVISARSLEDHADLLDRFNRLNVDVHCVLAYSDSAMYGAKRFGKKAMDLIPITGYPLHPKLADSDVVGFVRRQLRELKEVRDTTLRIGKRYYLRGLLARLQNHPRPTPNPKCVALRSHLRLLPDGSVPVCQFNTEKVGNLRTQSFEEVWHGLAAKDSRKWVDACKGCWAECEVMPSAIYSGDLLMPLSG